MNTTLPSPSPSPSPSPWRIVTDRRQVDVPFARTRSTNSGSSCCGRSRSSGKAGRRKSTTVRLECSSNGGIRCLSALNLLEGKHKFREAAHSALPEPPSVAAAASNSSDRTVGKMRNKVAAVFFDLDDTLVLTHEADRKAQLAVLDLLGAQAPQLDLPPVLSNFIGQLSNQAWDPEHKVEVTEWRARLWNNGMKSQGVDNMELAREMQSCFDRERLLGFRWTTSVEKLIRALHRQGVKVGIITNGHPTVQRAKLKACGATDLFDTILVGGEEANPKPHRDIFLKACSLAGSKPEESVMVGDTLNTDIKGAIDAGFLAAVWVNVHQKQPPNDAPKPQFEISTFSGLQQVLKHLGVHFDTSD